MKTSDINYLHTLGTLIDHTDKSGGCHPKTGSRDEKKLLRFVSNGHARIKTNSQGRVFLVTRAGRSLYKNMLKEFGPPKITLRRLREEKGLTQAEVCKASGLSRSAVYRIEKGGVIPLLKRMTDIFGVEARVEVISNGKRYELVDPS